MTTDTASSGQAPDRPPGQSVWEERLRILLESARDFAIFSTDTDRRVNYWSAGAERIFRFTEREMLGQMADVIFTPEDRVRGAPEEEAGTARAKGRAEDERWHQRKDGTVFYASGVMMSLRDAAGQLIGFAKIARDLTERKRMEDELRAAREALEHRVAERTVELDTANEELRTANEELRLEMRRREEAEALRLEAARRIGTVQEEERRRISREIHDELGQHLSALMLGLNALQPGLPVRAKELKELHTLGETISREMHAVALQLRPTALEDLGLERALESFVSLWAKRSGVRVDLDVSQIKGRRLPPDLEVALYRIVQEALTNVVKHARARLVSIVLQRKQNEVLAIIEDDGAGFDTSANHRKPGSGLGLGGMEERAAQFGGLVTFESEPGKGTTVFVHIPLTS